MHKWFKIVLSILICQMAGIIGSIFTSSKITSWYVTLQKPWFTPPNWVFGPVWITLFTLMGISLYIIWGKQNDKRFRAAIYLFGAQLFVNTIWNVLFFGLESPLLGLISIVIMWALIALTIVEFYRISKKAGLILLPYIIWVSIATALNFYVLVLNL